MPRLKRYQVVDFHYLLRPLANAAGTAQVSIDSNMTAADGPAPTSGFNQSVAKAATPPLPAAIEAAASLFQQTFGRRLHTTTADPTSDDLPSALRESSSADGVLSGQALQRRQLAMSEARLRDILADQQHL